MKPDEAIWAWSEEVTGDTRFGTVAKVREKVDAFFAGLAERTSEVKNGAAGNCKPRPMP